MDAIVTLYGRGHKTVTAQQVANELYPSARQSNSKGQVFNLAAGAAGRMMQSCKAVSRRHDRILEIVPEYLEIKATRA
jgi:hypothetical protein